MLVLGFAGAAVAVATGLRGAQGVMVALSVKQHLLYRHRDIMLGMLGLATLLTMWPILTRPLPTWGRYVFLALLVVLVRLLATRADYGGRTVYDYNVGGDARLLHSLATSCGADGRRGVLNKKATPGVS